MLLSVCAIVVNVIFQVVVNLEIYTDTAHFPDGSVRTWQRSPLTRLAIEDKSYLYYLQLVFAIISVVTSIMVLLKVKHSLVKTVQLVSTGLAILLFVIIMILTSNSHTKYA